MQVISRSSITDWEVYKSSLRSPTSGSMSRSVSSCTRSILARQRQSTLARPRLRHLQHWGRAQHLFRGYLTLQHPPRCVSSTPFFLTSRQTKILLVHPQGSRRSMNVTRSCSSLVRTIWSNSVLSPTRARLSQRQCRALLQGSTPPVRQLKNGSCGASRRNG